MYLSAAVELGMYREFENGPEAESNRTEYATLMSVASLCLWFKLFYFLRIFDSTSFLVRAIV